MTRAGGNVIFRARNNMLAEKKALITGASRGIGKAITDRFLAEGAEVWGVGTKEPEDLAQRIEKSAGKLHWQNADLGNLDTVEATIETLIKERNNP